MSKHPSFGCVPEEYFKLSKERARRAKFIEAFIQFAVEAQARNTSPPRLVHTT